MEIRTAIVDVRQADREGSRRRSTACVSELLRTSNLFEVCCCHDSKLSDCGLLRCNNVCSLQQGVTTQNITHYCDCSHHSHAEGTQRNVTDRNRKFARRTLTLTDFLMPTSFNNAVWTIEVTQGRISWKDDYKW
jgi:hypothetical protein